MLDAQMKRGFLEICVLAALAREDSYGYKIVKDMSACVSVTESTLYPILRRLESAGSLSVFSVEHNGRLRRYYLITEAGIQRIEGFIEEWKELMRIYSAIECEMEGEQA